MADPRAIDYLIGGVSSSCAVFFSNPIETVKVRMQLQGELQRTKGFVGPYKSPFHALYLISSKEGVWSLQKGLSCAIMYQLVMNGVRMGLYEHIKNLMGVHNNDHAIHEAGESNVKVAIKELIVFSKRVAAGAMAGAVGSYIASPFFLVKTRMQSQSDAIPGVGTQHKYTSMAQAFKHIVKHDGGILGLMRGSTAAALRVAVGGSVQLSTYDTCKHRLHSAFPDFFVDPTSVKLHLAASMVSGLAVTTAMNPFDVLSTRIYNQPVDEKGRGQLYKNPLDCLIKIGRVEGFRGFFKGWFAHYLRVGPHTVLMFVFMEQFKQLAASK